MRISPLSKVLQLAEASLIPYGPPESNIQVVGTFGELELEYAAIRKSCILLDLPHRGVLSISGKDRVDFLNRMVTQELKGLGPFRTAKAFWLNRKGRIDADLTLVELGSRMLVDVDILAAGRAVSGLGGFVITEDVVIEDVSETMHRMALHGPKAASLLAAVSTPAGGPGIQDLSAGSACIVNVGAHPVSVFRDDPTGEPGFELIVPAQGAADIFQRLVETGQEHDDSEGNGPASRFGLRPAGWHAFNIARIEAGRPLYNIDFGPDSLPHETGIIRDRVSFTKGCYLGQEVVARMESRGHSKKVLMSVKCDTVRGAAEGPESLPLQPVTGSAVWDASAPESDPVGVVTSSTLSPMLGSTPVCFAMIKRELATPGREVLVASDDPAVRLRGTTRAELAFWTRA